MLSDSVFDLAIQTAKTSPSRVKVGALLLNKNKVVATATNLERKSHPIQARFAERVGLHQKIYLHAEIAALVKCKEEYDTIVVARVNNQGKIRLAKPCPCCSLAIEESNIKRIYYTTNEGFLYEYN
jgi:tRNA(Arg) A34 adenosine deaminase TadA